MATVKKTIKKAQVGDTLVKKYPSVKMTTSKGYNTQETTYPGGDKKTLKYKVKKAQRGVTATKDSSAYFKNEQSKNYESAARNMSSPKYSEAAFKRAAQSGKDLDRQANKGKPGYDANGNPVKKKAAAGAKLTKAQDGIKKTSDSTSYYKQRADAALKNLASDDLSNFGSNVKDFAKKQREYKSYTRRNKPGNDAKGKSNFEKLLGLKDGGKVMMKRADGSTSQRGLWDNIRANKGSGKKPTSAMLKQEKKIKSQTKKK